MPLELDHVSKVATLPFHHCDPFDRILIAQSLVEDIQIVSVDEAFDELWHQANLVVPIAMLRKSVTHEIEQTKEQREELAEFSKLIGKCCHELLVEFVAGASVLAGPCPSRSALEISGLVRLKNGFLFSATDSR